MAKSSIRSISDRKISSSVLVNGKKRSCPIVLLNSFFDAFQLRKLPARHCNYTKIDTKCNIDIWKSLSPLVLFHCQRHFVFNTVLFRFVDYIRITYNSLIENGKLHQFKFKQASRSFVPTALISRVDRSNFARNPNLLHPESYLPQYCRQLINNTKKRLPLKLSLGENIVSSAGHSPNWFFMLFKTYFRTFVLIFNGFQLASFL